jgi:glutamate 5-kinase
VGDSLEDKFHTGRHRLNRITGTSSIIHEKTKKPLLSVLSLIVETAVKLREDGHRVVIVSSGAIGVGLKSMGMSKRPKHLPQVQVIT